ncbi:uncharacterized protein Dana_GF26251 [Drosophila ananassae]|uniref:Uncharacterized protein n=1 Tax=Drosophila ananassae TaxID=7217 RepID=A0A0P8Y723_DROAN|nr:uncharacterized protein Dana_GF26251 [Drosophila ananassae]
MAISALRHEDDDEDDSQDALVKDVGVVGPASPREAASKLLRQLAEERFLAGVPGIEMHR